MRNDVTEFLSRHGMNSDMIDREKERVEFIRQMEDGLAGRGSSLLMIPTFITVSDAFQTGERVIVMDAGGTNLRVATVCFGEDGAASVEDFQKYPMPGTKGKLVVDTFFETLAEYLRPVLAKSDKIGFCFSFPTQILPSRDGRILNFTKEVLVEGAEGCILGERINAVLQKQGIEKKQFVILNDTVATMLGGIVVSKERTYENYIGYILGTGTNTCYLEASSKIAKSPQAMEMGGQMAINMESGGYNGFAQGTYDRQLDAGSVNPGKQQMEKMISGAYQGSLIFKTVEGAAREMLFSAQFVAGLAAFEDFTMRQIDEFCAQPQGGGALALLASSEQDREKLYAIVDASFERSALMAAINFAAIITHGGVGKDPKRPVCITAEGTSFTKSVLFSKKLDSYIKSYLNEELGVYCEVITASDVTLSGTAIAALMTN